MCNLWRSYSKCQQNGQLAYLKKIEPGDRILLIMHDSISLVCTFLGAIHVGSIPIILNTLLEPESYEFFGEDSEAQLCITDQNHLNKNRFRVFNPLS